MPCSPGCVCERHFGEGNEPPELRQPTTQAELQAALDRAYNAGVRHGREREKRERIEGKRS